MEKQKKSKATIMDLNWGVPLPLHIGPVIFSKLPFSNLPVCRLVCKSWNHLLLHYAFSPKFHFPNTIIFPTFDKVPDPLGGPLRFINPKIRCFDIDTLSFVASCVLHSPPVTCYTSFMNCCNGLLFIHRDNFSIDSQEGIFNPMTGEFFLTPTGKSPHTKFHGFGLSAATKHYKLFRCGVDDSTPFTSKMKVLRFGINNNQWSTSIILPSPITLMNHGAYFDGVIYWPGKDRSGNNNNIIIYALDVETEKFEGNGVLKVGPRCIWVMVQPFNGTIYAIAFMTEPTQIEVWKMQKKDSWVREFIAPGQFRGVRLVKACKDGKIFLLSQNDLFCLSKGKRKRNSNSKIKMRIKKIQALFPYNTQYMGHCLLESIHFGSLPNILAGHVEDQGVALQLQI